MIDSPEWQNAVRDLKAKAAEFTGLYDRAMYSRPQTPGLAQKREQALDNARAIKATIERTTQAIDWAYAKYESLFGDNTDESLQGLGVVWFIPVAAITGAVAGVTYGIKQFKDYLSDNDKIERLTAEGHSTEQALEILRQGDPGIGAGIERGLKAWAPWIAAGIAAYFLLNKRLKF